MLPLPRGAVWQLLFLFCAALYIHGVRSEGRVVCYYTNWSVYRPGTAKFNPQNINPYLCTHLIYAFGGFTKDNQMKPFDKYQDIEQGGYAKFTGLKTYNKQLKTMIAIGGWNEASSRFSPLVASTERRQKFIKNILKFLRQNHFDGIDLDWEYPAHREGGKTRDRDNYAQFVQELRAEFEREAEKTGRPRLLVTMAVPAGIEYIEKGYDIPKLNKYLDWFNVLTYDFHSSHEPSVNHHAPLYSLEEESEYNYDAELNIDYSIKFYLNAGADKDKLVLGIPTYGRSYTLINEESTEIGAPAEAPGEQGDATREKGYLAYYEICQNLKEDPEWTVVQPNPNAMGPYAYRRNQWVGYDDEAIVRKKAQYVVDNGLGGIMFWAIDNDDFRGTCTGKQYPLIEAAKDAMLEALGLGINEVSKPSAPQKPLRSRSRENSSSTRNRITTSEQKLTYAERKGSAKRTQTTQQNTSKKQQTTTNAPETIKLTEEEGSSLYIGGRTTTPPPPTTPDPGADFKCEEEGFFQHPRDCKKYFWCLDSGPSGLGIVAHQFTCPSGLYFNPAADSCDFARNVPCKIKKSTTAAPVTTPLTTTTTTPRPTQSVNRLTAATSRTSFFRTTSTSTTTTTTEAPEEETEYEEDEDNVPSPFAKPKGIADKEAEEDPKVIKELIELIRKVGGIEELEKHLLRKDDGTIAIKENSSSSSSSSLISTTPPSISKSLYEKVLSKPNALNSFRNRFTSSSSFRNKQTKTEIKAQNETEEEKEESDEIDTKTSGASAGYSKYSSVVRGNSRQGPQNEGIDKLNEFDGFLKEKKQYITINRNRGNKKVSIDEEEEEEESVNAKSQHYSNEDDEEEVEVRTSKRPTSTTPAYSTIRRTRPATTTEAAEKEEEVEQEEKEEDVNERKSYSSLNRSRARGTTTTEQPDVTEVTAGSTRYKYLERTRPTRPTTESSNKLNDEEDDEEESEDHENTVHLKANENTRETQQEITTKTQRTYASIGRRTTTIATPETETTTIAAKTATTTAIPTTSTTETPITTPLTYIETTTPESIIISTTNSNIPITTTTNPTTISTTTTTSTTTTNLPNGEDVLESLATTPYPNEINADSETLNLSLKSNSLLTESASTSSSNFPPTTESGLDTNEQEIDSLVTTTTTETTGSTTTEANDIVPKTEDLATKQQETNEEVNLVSKQRNKTLYTTRTRTTTTTPQTTTTITYSDIETTSSPTTNTKNQLGVRRQQLLLNRSSQTKTTTTDIPTITTESVNNDFLGTVSSPRPFGFPKRRTRPTTSASVSTTTTEEIEKPNEESLITRQKTTKLNAAVNSQTKVSSHNTILSETATEIATETSSQQDHAHKQKESEVTSTEHVYDKDTKVEHIKKHVVKQVDGFEGSTNNFKHVNTVDSSHNDIYIPKIKTHTIVEEVDDDDDKYPHKSFSWRDARKPTKPTPKMKKIIVTEVITEERVRQSLSPDHVTVVNGIGNNEKDLSFNRKEENTRHYSGKYKGKSLETSLEHNTLHQDNQVDDGNEVDEEGRAFRTYTTINRRRNQNKQSTGIGEDEVSLSGFKVTEVVRSGGTEDHDEASNEYTSLNRTQSTHGTSSSKTTGENQNVDNENVEVVKTKVKYTTLNRGHTEEDSEINRDQKVKSDDNKDSEGSALKTKFNYATITRGQSAKTVTENSESDSVKTNLNSGHILKTKDDTVTENSQRNTQEDDDSQRSGLKTKFKYATITRGQTAKTEGESASSNQNEKDISEVKTQENYDDNAQTTTGFKYTKITREQGTRGTVKEEDSKNSKENDDDQTTTGFKYTKIIREHATQGTVANESENAKYPDHNQTTSEFKYSKITRGQGTQGTIEGNTDTETKTKTNLNRNSGSQTFKTHENSRYGNSENETERKTYTTISRNRDSIKNHHESESDSEKKDNLDSGHILKTEDDIVTENSQRNTHEDDDSQRLGLKTKFKYTTVTRGQTANIEGESASTDQNEKDISETQEGFDDNGQTTTSFKYTNITRKHVTQGTVKEEDSENAKENDDDQITTGFKYTKIIREHATLGTVANKSENAKNLDDNQTTSKFKYSKITRGHGTQGTVEENTDTETKTKTTLNTNSGSQALETHENSRYGNSEKETERKTHTTISRNRDSIKNHQESESDSEKKDNLDSAHILKTENDIVTENSQRNTHEDDDSQRLGLKTKFNYTTETRGQTAKIEGESASTDQNKKDISEVNTQENNDDNDQTTTRFKYTKITREQGTQGIVKAVDSENAEENDDDHTTTGFKYTKIIRGHATKGTVANESENAKNLDDNQTTSKFKYTKITRAQGTQGTVEENTDTETKTTLNRNGSSQTLRTQESSRYGNSEKEPERKTYTTISRNRGSIKNHQETEGDSEKKENLDGFRTSTIYVSNTENIPYKAIVRGSDGVHLTEGELSGFVKSSGGVITTTTEEKSEKNYQTISRGGQIHQSLDNEKSELELSKIHEMEAISLTHVEEENKKKTDAGGKTIDNVENKDLTVEIKEVVEKSDHTSTTEAETSTTESIQTTTTEEPRITSTTTESTTTTSEEPSSTSTEEPFTTTEEVTTESSTELVTPETVTNRILFRNRASTTTTTTTSEPTTRRSLFRNRGSTTSTKAATDNEEAENEASTRRTIYRARTTTKVEEEESTQTPRRRTVLRRRPTSATTEATVEEETQGVDHVDHELEINKATQTNLQSSGNAQTTSFHRRTVIRKKPTSIEQKFDVFSTATESSVDDTSSTSRHTLSRGSYRPSEKGDLSSLLALDLAKKYGNKSQHSFGNDKRRRPIETPSEEQTEANDSTNSEAAHKELLTTQSDSSQTELNGRRKTIIRKRIQSTKVRGRENTVNTEGNTLIGQKGEIKDASNSDSEVKNNSTNSEAAHKESLTAESDSSQTELNGHTKTIIRKRIQTTKLLGRENTQNIEGNTLIGQKGEIKDDSNFEFEVKKTSTNSGDAHQESLSTESDSPQTELNGRRKTIIRKRIQSTKLIGRENAQNTEGNTLIGQKGEINDASNSESEVKKTSTNSEAAHKESFSTESDSTQTELNGRRKTIIRKRIQNTKLLGRENTQNTEGNTLIGQKGEIKDASNSESEVKKTFITESESSKNSSTSSDAELSKIDSNSKNFKSDVKETFNNESETSKTLESSSNGDLSKTEVNNQTLTEANDTSDNSEFNTTDQQTSGNVKTNAFNSKNHKYAFAAKRITESRTSQIKETGKEVTGTETNNSDSSASQNDQNSVDNSISNLSGSKFQSRNTLNSQTPENSRESAFSNRRGSFNTRLQNNRGKTEEIETLEDGTTRIKTTHVETVNTGDNTVKTIKRTKTKTIVKQAPDYEYEIEDISVAHTTRRPINRNRGSVRFESNDLSSLLALDFASKANRKVEGNKAVTKSRRKLIRKPDIVTETEHVEEYEEELATRPPRPSTTTEAAAPISRRTRPTRPLRTTTTTTTKAPETEKEEVEEEIISTTRRNFAFKRPTSTTTTKAPVNENSLEQDEESTTRRNIAFRRPAATRRTFISTKAAVVQTEQENETTITRTKVVNRFKFKQPTTTTTEEPTTTGTTTTTESTTTTEEPTTVYSTTPETTTTTTTEFVPSTTASPSSELEETTTTGTTTESTEEPTTISSTSPETITNNTTEFVPSTTTSPSSDSSTVQYVESTTEVLTNHDPLDTLKNQLSNAVHKLKTETKVVENVIETEVSDAMEMKHKISTAEDINLPIYHRRKYYQYYKDSPIVHVNPITAAPDTLPQTNVDIAKQIHDVFNVSNDHLIEPDVSGETEALLAVEQAQEINSELSNFLLKIPGSK